MFDIEPMGPTERLRPRRASVRRDRGEEAYMMTPDMLEGIMADIAEGDPLDFGGLSIDEKQARMLLANHLCRVDRQLDEMGVVAEQRAAFMAAIAAHALVENMLLNVEKIRRAHSDGAADFGDWMRRHGIGGAIH
jgi:hypothetical protein